MQIHTHKSKNKHTHHIITWGGKQFVAFFIGLGVMFAPLEIPLELWVHEKTGDEVAVRDTQNQSPKEYYESHLSDPTDDIVVFEKGKPTPEVSAPIITKDEAQTPIPSPLLAMTDENAMAEAVKQNPKKIKIRESSYHNIIAASQVANGENLSELTSVALDEDANIVAVTDEHGETKLAEYNNDGQPIKIERPDGTTSYFSYDERGNLTGISHTESTKVSHTGFLGVLARAFPPLFAVAETEESTSLEYGEGGIETISSNGEELSFEYDEDGLLSREYRLDGSAVDYYYDELGNVVETVEVPNDGDVFSLRSFFSLSLADIVFPTFTQTAEYDDSNLLARVSLYKDVPTEETVAPSVPAPAVEQIPTDTSVPAMTETNTETQPTEATLPPAPLVPVEVAPAVEVPVIAPELEVAPALVSWLTRTGSAMLSAVKDALSFSYADETSAEPILEEAGVAPSVPAVLDVAYTYDAFGNIIKSESNDGVITSYTYDHETHTLIEKSVTTATGKTVSYHYSTNADARTTSKNGEVYEYTDSLMLARAGANSYTYDERGNRTLTQGSEGASYIYDGNRLVEVAYANGRATRYSYDEEGRVVESVDTEKGHTAFTYTLGGAIESITSGDETITYAYDGLNRRTSRTSSLTGTVTYTYAGNTLKKVSSEDGTILREYFYTPKGELIALMSGGALYHVVTDKMQSVVALVDSTNGVVSERTYGAWGNIVSDTLPHIDLGYLGVFDEPSLNLSVLGPRVYDPEIGRFLSKDPLPGVIIDSLSQHEYIYAKNDPVNQYDPSGHESVLAEQSISPKRALVETEKAIEGMHEELAITKEKVAKLEALVLITPDDVDVQNALLLAKGEMESQNTTLDLMKDIRSTQESEVLEAEQSAMVSVEIIAPSVETTTSTTIIEVSATTTPEEVVTITEVIEHSVAPTQEETLPNIPEVAPEEAIAPTTEGAITTPSLPEAIIISMMGSVAHIAKAFIDDHLKIADAKSKKKKAKAKKEKKKKAVKQKAKDKQKKTAKKLASIKKQLDKIEKEVAKLKAKKINEPNTKVTFITDEFSTKKDVKKVENPLQGMTAVNKTQVLGLTYGPTQPVTTAKSSIAAAGVTAPKVTSDKTLFGTIKEFFTGSTGAHLGLTACGFEPTLIGASCGILDGTLYIFEGKWGDAGLSVLSAVPIVGATGDVTKAGKLAVEMAGKARVAKTIATLSRTDMPIYAKSTLNELEKCGWVRNWPNQANGRQWANKYDQLPPGHTYTEWDVIKVGAGESRDVERFVKSSNGDIYYTNTHYGDMATDIKPAFYLIK